MMNRIQAVIFDCFGVLIPDVLQSIVAELQRTDPPAAQEIRDLIDARNRGLVESHASNGRIAEILGMRLEDWRAFVDRRTVKDEKLMAYILELKRHGLKTALLSNVGSQSLRRRFAEEELRSRFDAVVESHELGLVKPDPEIYLRTADKLDLKPEACVFADDREENCKGAEAVGMRAILYQDFTQFKSELKKILSA